MHDPTSVLENYTHKLLGNFEIKTHHLISSRRPDYNNNNQQQQLQQLKQNRTSKIVDFAVQADERVKLKREKKDIYLDLTWELKKLGYLKVPLIPIIIDTPGSHQRINKRISGLGNKKTSGNIPNFCII